MNSRARPGEHALFNQNKSMLELQNQIPQPLLALDGQLGFLGEKKDMQELRTKSKTDTEAQVEKIFRAVEKQLIQPKFPGIVEDSLKC